MKTSSAGLLCCVPQAGIEFGNKECILIQLSSSARLHWPSVTSLCGHLGIMQAGSRKAHGKATFDAMCLVGQVLQQAENSVAMICLRPQTLNSRISRLVKTYHHLLSRAPVSGRGMWVSSQSRQFYSVAAVRAAGSRRSVAHHACFSGTDARHHVSPSGGGPLSISLRWCGFLGAQFVQSLLFAVVC